MFSLLDEILKDLFVPQRIHGAPEALVLQAQELVGLDQPLERRLNQFLAFAHVVEDIRAEHKEAPVDPEVGIPARANPVDLAVLRYFDEMQTEGRPHGKKAGDLPALPEGLDHLRQIHIGETVAVIRKEHLLAGDMLAYGPQALADVAPNS